MREQLQVPLRWRDLDHQGHVYHGTLPALLDEARVQWLERAVLSKSLESHVIARLEIDYLDEITHADAHVSVAFSIERVGRTSFATNEVVTVQDGREVAKVRAVLVAWDPEGRCKRVLTSGERVNLLSRADKSNT